MHLFNSVVLIVEIINVHLVKISLCKKLGKISFFPSEVVKKRREPFIVSCLLRNLYTDIIADWACVVHLGSHWYEVHLLVDMEERSTEKFF